MKDIQNIMEEMNNLSDQMAVTLNEEKTDPVVAPQQVVTCDECSGTGGETICSAIPNVSRTVNFTCNLAAPDGFLFVNALVFNTNTRLIYDLNCLHCFVEPCICTTTAGNPTRYAVRVVGSIPFIFNQRVNPQANECRFNNGDVFVCCSDSVCVDNTICFACSEVGALVACELIRRSLTSCSGVILTALTLTPCTDNPALATIRGTFTLPACNGAGAAASVLTIDQPK